MQEKGLLFQGILVYTYEPEIKVRLNDDDDDDDDPNTSAKPRRANYETVS